MCHWTDCSSKPEEIALGNWSPVRRPGEIKSQLSEGLYSANGLSLSTCNSSCSRTNPLMISSLPELTGFLPAVLHSLFSFSLCFYSLLSCSSSLFDPFFHHKATCLPYHRLLPLLLLCSLIFVGAPAASPHLVSAER